MGYMQLLQHITMSVKYQTVYLFHIHWHARNQEFLLQWSTEWRCL